MTKTLGRGHKMGNDNINNLRNSISHTPKLHEWEGKFIQLNPELTEILENVNLSQLALTLLQETGQLPGITVGDMTSNYKGAVAHYGTRLDLSGQITLNFKEVKGAGAPGSWSVRRFFKQWIEKVDSFRGNKVEVAKYKAGIQIAMQDEAGDDFYKVRYFGLFPFNVAEQTLTYTLEGAATYPVISVGFQYDYWRDQYDVDQFGN